MQLALNPWGQWFIRTPLQSSPNGWSKWVPYPRMEALNLIERGFDFVRLTETDVL